MKIIEACLILYYDKDHHTNGNTNSQSCDVNTSVNPVTDQSSECGFKIIFKHKQLVLCFNSTIEMPVYNLYEHQLPGIIRSN
jgi:hypothetical protein